MNWENPSLYSSIHPSIRCFLPVLSQTNSLAVKCVQHGPNITQRWPITIQKMWPSFTLPKTEGPVMTAKKTHAHLCFLPLHQHTGPLILDYHTHLSKGTAPFSLMHCGSGSQKEATPLGDESKRSRERIYPNQPFSHHSIKVSSFFYCAIYA